MLDIGAIAPGLDMHIPAVGMLTQYPPLFFGGLGEQVNSTVQADGQQIVLGWQAGKAALIFQIGAKPAETSLNHVAGFWVRTNIAWQCQQADGAFKIEISCRQPLWQRGTFWFFRLRIAKLDIGAIWSTPQIDRQAGRRVITNVLITYGRIILIGVITAGELTGEFTLRIV